MGRVVELREYFIYGFGFFATLFIIWLLSPVARNIGLVDEPNTRKQHEFPVPLIGGIAIVITFLMSLLLVDFTLQPLRILVFGVALLLLVGVLDDHRDLPPFGKLLGQVATSLVLVVIGGLEIQFIGDIFATGVVHGLGFLAIPVTVLFIILVINAYNLIDGHDGLASGCLVVSLFGLAFLCFKSGEINYQRICLLLLSILVAFMLYNLPFIVGKRRQVFMGDAGSMFLGLFAAFMILELSTGPEPSLKLTAAPWILGLPLLDMLGVVAYRIMGRKSPVKADRSHIHHIVRKAGLGNYSTLLVLLAIHFGLVAVGVWGSRHNWQDYLLFRYAICLLVFYLLAKWVMSKTLPKILSTD